MQADDELCLCFHITWRKVINYSRIHQVKLPSQLADCGGAGTGCGWCRRSMKRLIERLSEAPPDAEEVESWLAKEFPTSKDMYAAQRTEYRSAKPDTPNS